jgi:penicillin-binding protein 2
MSPMPDLEDRRPPLSPQLAVRVAILGGIALALFAVIFFRLWFLQVLSGDEYLVQARENRTRDVRIQAPRGEIVDRNGTVLVDNRPANVVQIEPQELPEQVISDAATWGQMAGRRMARPKGKRGEPVPLPPIATPELAQRYRRLARLLGMRASTIHQRVIEQLAQLPYSAVTVRSDAPNSVLGYIKERQELFPGIGVERVFLRDYPRDQLAAHLLGTVGEISPKELKQRRNRGVEQGTIIGKGGLEYTYDRYLRGRDGAKVLRVDANGRFVSDQPVDEREPVPGRQLQLSIDLGLQKAGQDALRGIGGGLPGSFVAMNPRNGQVYAMGSYPSFDPSIFSKPVSRSRYEELTSEENGAPLINRAVASAYPTGSTFKPVTALAALDKKVITPDAVINDPGCIKIGTREACNAKKTAYGGVNMRRALQVSSDVYFYILGRDLFFGGGETLQKWARKLGFNRRSGLDLPEESRGLIPGRKWREEINQTERKCRKTNDDKPCYAVDIRPYNAGDNVNLAVGQGEIAATPLQSAIAYSTIITGGRVPRPHIGMEIQDASNRLVQKIDPGTARKVKIEKAWRDAIMDGLGLAAREAPGTSAGVFAGWPNGRLPIYGKTGTAETFVNGGAFDQSWYVGYVPHPTKPIVIAATIERGGFGAEKAAPLVRRMLANWFDLPERLARPSGGEAGMASRD